MPGQMVVTIDRHEDWRTRLRSIFNRNSLSSYSRLSPIAQRAADFRRKFKVTIKLWLRMAIWIARSEQRERPASPPATPGTNLASIQFARCSLPSERGSHACSRSDKSPSDLADRITAAAGQVRRVRGYGKDAKDYKSYKNIKGIGSRVSADKCVHTAVHNRSDHPQNAFVGGHSGSQCLYILYMIYNLLRPSRSPALAAPVRPQL